MPRTATISNSLLGIQLEGGLTKYAPGDTIIGYVFRQQPLLGSSATVTITLHGRTKSRMVVSQDNNNNRTFRSRFNLLSPSKNMQRIFEGPVHITAGTQETWPFAITIPRHVDDRSLGSPIPRNKNGSYLSLQPEAVLTQELPSTFTNEHRSFRTNSDAFVEYFLRAELKSASQNSTEKFEACMPITLRKLNPDPPITDFKINRNKSSRFVSAYHLVPGMEQTELSFSQKRRQFFNSSKVPTMWFGLQVDTPTIIQLDNPNTFPFVVCAAPEWNRCSDALQGVEQTANLRSLSITIVAQTEMKCEGYFGAHEQTLEDKVELRIPDVLIGRSITIPINDEHPRVDIGALIGLRIGRYGRIGAMMPQGTLTPNFTTYNIKHTHVLKWSLSCDVGGEQFKAVGSHHVTIVRASDESRPGIVLETAAVGPSFVRSRGDAAWIRPPPDEEPSPPTFDQVLAEDAMRVPDVQTSSPAIQASS